MSCSKIKIVLRTSRSLKDLDLEEHLERCPSCRRGAWEEERLDEFFRQNFPSVSPSARVWNGIESALAQDEVVPVPFPARFRHAGFAAVAAAVILLVLASTLLLSSYGAVQSRQEIFVLNTIERSYAETLLPTVATQDNPFEARLPIEKKPGTPGDDNPFAQGKERQAALDRNDNPFAGDSLFKDERR